MKSQKQTKKGGIRMPKEKTTKTIFKELSQLKNEKAELAALTKTVNKQIENRKKDLIVEMKKLGVDKLSGEGITASLSEKMNVKIVDPARYVSETLKEHPELLIKRVNTPAVRHLMQEGVIPDTIEIDTYESLSIRNNPNHGG
jgi:hypothetical protein